MGFFDSILSRKGKKTEERADAGLYDGFASKLFDTSNSVDEKSVRGIAAWWRGVNVLSGMIAGLPRHTFIKLDNGREQIDTTLKEVLSGNPFGHQNTITWHELAISDLLNKGNFVGVIVNRNPVQIQRIPPEMVKVYVHEDEVVYEIQNKAKDRYLAHDMFHLMWYSDDGYWGVDPISVHRKNLSIGLSAQRVGKDTFDNGVFADKVIYKSGKATVDQLKKIREGITNSAQGGRIIPLDDGFEIKELNSPNLVNMQFLETRQYQDKEVANILGLPLALLNGNEPKYDNMEGFWKQLIITTVLPIVRKFEHELKNKGLREADKKKGVYVRYGVEGLMRGDSRAQAEYFDRLIKASVIKPSEVRELLDMNYLDESDVLMYQSNNQDPLKYADEIAQSKIKRYEGGNKQQ